MSGFYRRPKSDAPLSQGDIFDRVPMLGVSLEPLAQVVDRGTTVEVQAVAPDALADGMLILEKVILTPAIVLSQSCDAERAQGILLAPLVPFRMEGKKADQQWRRINNAATSLNEPKQLYLPGNPELGFQRQTADFGDAFTLPRTFLLDLARRGRRVAGLGKLAGEYLQFRLGVMLTRVAQDDYAWPSAEDLDIKLSHLTESIEEAKKKADKLKAEISQASTEAKEALEEKLAYQTDVIAELMAECAKATEARRSADQLEA